MKLLVGLLATVLGILGIMKLSRFESLRKAKKIEVAFANRDALSTEQFYERFFWEQGVPLTVVKGVREVLEAQLGVEMSRLLDSDDFSKNLSFFWDFDSLADVEIVQALEKRFSITIADDEAVNTHTVRDIVELVWSKLNKT